MADSSRPAEPQGPAVNATRARQGRFGRQMVWVLAVSTLLAAIGLLLAWTWKAPGLASNSHPHVNAGKTFSAPAPASVVPQPAQPTKP